ncbi:MAG TPA: RDD family protein [Candidatus Hydrogenedentes bacterium]|nr:RDD family protein [Candidatus Hydrogenedentota bacterium]HOL76944.1 RDD family protein [Candidatus Hydrogenedentota bacterium]HPO86667.1 RDD family protein [Candidatus Hydrogenedentota bacterium]
MNSFAHGIEIHTPDGVTFSLVLAGLLRRFSAWLVDQAVVGVSLAAFSRLFIPVVTLFPDLATSAIILISFLVSTGYSIVLEWFWRGQTLGKRLFRLRVMDEAGLPLKFNQIVIRNLIRVVDALPVFYLVGGICCFISKKSQRLGDYAANTVVIRIPETVAHRFDRFEPEKYNSFRDYPHLCARLRQLVSAEAAFLAWDALARRNDFVDEARLRLFSEIARYFRELVQFPEEATYGLTDEQYVRNAVGILFQPAVPGPPLSAHVPEKNSGR